MIANIWRYVESMSFLKISLIAKSICAGSRLMFFAAEYVLLCIDHPRQAHCIGSLPFLVTSRVQSTKNWPKNFGAGEGGDLEAVVEKGVHFCVLHVIFEEKPGRGSTKNNQTNAAT